MQPQDCGFKVLVLPSVVTGGAIHDSISLNRDHSPPSNNPKSGKALGRVGIPQPGTPTRFFLLEPSLSAQGPSRPSIDDMQEPWPM